MLGLKGLGSSVWVWVWVVGRDGVWFGYTGLEVLSCHWSFGGAMSKKSDEKITAGIA